MYYIRALLQGEETRSIREVDKYWQRKLLEPSILFLDVFEDLPKDAMIPITTVSMPSIICEPHENSFDTERSDAAYENP